MAQQTEPSSLAAFPRVHARGWRERASTAGWLVAAAAMGGLLLVALDRLSVPEALGVIGFVAAAGLLLPRFGQRRAIDEAVSPLPRLDEAVARFADTLSDPCILIDRRAVVVYRNPATLHHFPRLAVGDPVAFGLRHPAVVGAIAAAKAQGKAQRTDLHLTVPHAVWYTISVVPYSPVPGDDMAPFLVITLSDLTEQKRIDQMRSDFIANASHELRTPLTSLVGFIETLLGPAAKDEQARTRFLAIMRGQAERMSGLIDDLLSLSRIELHQHVRPTGRVDLALVIREVVETLEPRLSAENVTVELAIEEGPAMVTGDRNELFEVVENLADNALKYGGEGGTIAIALRTDPTRPDNPYALTVADRGSGIPQEHVPRLTERFYRVDTESSRRKKGTGLGLAIVKHIVHRHRGEMTIRSELGKGTRVEIVLPR